MTGKGWEGGEEGTAAAKGKPSEMWAQGSVR